jgi:hypothetical protein
MSGKKSVAGASMNALAKTSGGPRTAAGKEKSKLNAVKHGIFANVVRKDESRKFNSIWQGLRDSLGPEGTLEELLVEKMAVITLRHLRLLGVESAEISISVDFFEGDQELRQRERAHEILQEEHPGDDNSKSAPNGLARHIANPIIARVCIERLEFLKKSIEEAGLSGPRDYPLLLILYGGGIPMDGCFFVTYTTYWDTAKCSEDERREHGYISPEECAARTVKAIDAEIRRIAAESRSLDTINAAKAKLNKQALSVPQSPNLERYIRYEASLERAFDRTLAQLERLQRIRRGQPVLPAIKVDVTS